MCIKKNGSVLFKRFINEPFPFPCDDKRVKLVTLPYLFSSALWMWWEYINVCSVYLHRSGKWGKTCGNKWFNLNYYYLQIMCVFGDYMWNSLNLPEMLVYFDILLLVCCEWNKILWEGNCIRRIYKVVQVKSKRNTF